MRRRIFQLDPDVAPYFVTTVTLHRNPIFAEARVARLFVDTLYDARAGYGFLLLSFAVMPDHVHLVLLPSGRNQISDVVRFIKGAFARNYNARSATEGSIWQPSFYRRLVRSNARLRAVVAYVDKNPVVGALTNDVLSYEFCSANGRYETDLEAYIEDRRPG